MIASTSSSEGTTTLATHDESAALQLSMEKLLAMLETCSEYVDKVVDGTISPDDETDEKFQILSIQYRASDRRYLIRCSMIVCRIC